MILPFQYCFLNFYIIFETLGNVQFLPATTCLAALTFIRCYFLTKILKAVNNYTNSRESEKICNSFGIQADISFAFKAAQKESPFFYLFLFFVGTSGVWNDGKKF